MASKKELTQEQQRIKEESAVLIKILGLLDGLSNSALAQVKDAAQRRLTPQADPEPEEKPIPF